MGGFTENKKANYLRPLSSFRRYIANQYHVVSGYAQLLLGKLKEKKGENKETVYVKLLSSITRHDIANQCQAVSGYAQLLLVKLKEKYSEQDKEIVFLNKIIAASKKINSQIAFWREYEMKGGMSWNSLEQICRNCKNFIPDEIEIKIGEGMEKIIICADPLILKVFENLIGNTAMHGGHASEINLSFKEENNNLVIIYEDNGVGVVPEEKERIFEEGFGKNTGLGMFLSRQILLMNGMTISETGEYGKGARFEIVVPQNAYRIIQ